MSLYLFLSALGKEIKKSCQQLLLIMAIIAAIVVVILIAIGLWIASHSIPAAIVYAAIVIGVPWWIFRDPPANATTNNFTTPS